MVEYLECALTVLGGISFLIAVLRFLWVVLPSSIEWIGNFSVREEVYDANIDYTETTLEDGTAIYPVLYKDDESDTNCLSVNYIMPKDIIIKNLIIKKADPKSYEKLKTKYKKVKTIPQITQEMPLCMIIDRGECIAPYMIQWRIKYGTIVQYYFDDNMRNGSNNKSGIVVKRGLVAKTRQFFGLE